MSESKHDVPVAIEIGLQLEYSSLRREVFQRIKDRQQTVSITLTIAGVFLSFGLGNPGIALIFPPISFLLATGWAQNEIRIRQINKYIRDQLEPKIPGVGWETFTMQRNMKAHAGPIPLAALSPAGTFLLTQVFAVGLGLVQFTVHP